jgi:hypothetical protein
VYKRQTRLRVTCDNSYPLLIKEIRRSLQQVFPNNSVAISAGQKATYCNVSVYSNKLDDYLPWVVGKGSKCVQNISVPNWILTNKKYSISCLRGLLQTDGSIYTDRGYLMVNFTNNIEALAQNVESMIQKLGYQPHTYKTMQRTGNYKYTVRLSRNVRAFISEIGLFKS